MKRAIALMALLLLVLLTSCVPKKTRIDSGESELQKADRLGGRTLSEILFVEPELVFPALFVFHSISQKDLSLQISILLDMLKTGNKTLRASNRDPGLALLVEGLGDIVVGTIGIAAFVTHPDGKPRKGEDPSIEKYIASAKYADNIAKIPGGLVKVLDFVVRNPHHPISKKVLSFVAKRIPKMMGAFNGPLLRTFGDGAKLAAGAAKVTAGSGSLVRASNADGDLLKMADDLTRGTIEIGDGACDLAEAMGAEGVAVPAALFKLASFIYKSDGFADSTIMTQLRKPLETRENHEALKAIFTSDLSTSHERVWMRFEASTRRMTPTEAAILFPPKLRDFLKDGFNVAYSEYKRNCDAILPYTKILCDLRKGQSDATNVRKSFRLRQLVCRNNATSDSCQ